MTRLRAPWRHRGLTAITSMVTAGRENVLPNLLASIDLSVAQWQKPMSIERIFSYRRRRARYGGARCVRDSGEKIRRHLHILDESAERIGQKMSGPDRSVVSIQTRIWRVNAFTCPSATTMRGQSYLKR